MVSSRRRRRVPIAVLLLMLSGRSSDGSEVDPETLDNGSETGSENPSEIEDPTAPTNKATRLSDTATASGFSPRRAYDPSGSTVEDRSF